MNDEMQVVRIKHLLVPVKEAHALFVDNSDNMCVSYPEFAELCPAHVCLQSDILRNVCTCIIHENMKFLVKALHKKHVPVEIEIRKFINKLFFFFFLMECKPCQAKVYLKPYDVLVRNILISYAMALL